MPNFAEVHRELRKRHVTKMLLWQEYREQHAHGLGYSQFCEHFAARAKPPLATMRQTHHAGDKLFVDFSGDGIRVFDAASGEYRTAKLFVAVLGAGNLTYVEPIGGISPLFGCSLDGRPSAPHAHRVDVLAILGLERTRGMG
jgi:transposase